jgi:putative phosphoribosyl transferase
MLFKDRTDGGKKLVPQLTPFRQNKPLVIGLPRGGMAVAAEVASRLGGELDVWAVRKLSHPLTPEKSVGAIAEGDGMFMDDAEVKEQGLSHEDIREMAQREGAELKRRAEVYRKGRPLPEISGRCVVVVDDGIATGASAHAVAKAIRMKSPARLILAVPVGAKATLESLTDAYDEVICTKWVKDTWGVGAWYENARSLSDQDVVGLLLHAQGG